MSNVVILKNWSVLSLSDPYTPPEMSCGALQGNAYGHPMFEDGKKVITSVPIYSKGRILKTRGGRIYKLGNIDPEYRKWLKRNIPEWDWRHPVPEFGNKED